MREAVALPRRVQLQIDGHDDPVIAGFFRDDRLAIYFGGDPVFQFDVDGRLRRAFVNGRLYRTQGSTLAELSRIRTADSTELSRRDLSSAELEAFLREMENHLRALRQSISLQPPAVLRQVSVEGDILPLLAQRLDLILSTRVHWPPRSTGAVEQMPARLLVIGCGYLGRRVAANWQSQGGTVSSLTRSPENAAFLSRLGIEPIVGDVLEPATLRSLPESDVVLYAVGYDRTAGNPKREVYVQGLEHVLAEIAPRVGRFLYVSSTSVYGQDAGELVDESSPTEPTGEDGRICLAAEQTAWRFFHPTSVANVFTNDDCSRDGDATTRGAIVLRFSGIYGPGRLLRRIESVRSGETISPTPTRI